MKDAADLARWAAHDFVYNLEALPADRLDWRPTPEAKSALQIAGEVAGAARGMLPVLEGRDLQMGSLPQPQTLEEARALVLDSMERYAAALEKADPAKLTRVLDLPFGQYHEARFVLFPLVEVIHHRGQIVYLQSLLGDAESRFDPDATARCFGPGAGK